MTHFLKSPQNGVLSGRAGDRKIALLKEFFRVTFLIPRNYVEVHMRNVLAGLHSIVLKNVRTTRGKRNLDSNHNPLCQRVDTGNLALRYVENRLAVFLWDDQRSSTFILTMIDERHREIVLGYDCAFDFSGNVSAEAAGIAGVR